jgi:hypothetical protein
MRFSAAHTASTTAHSIAMPPTFGAVVCHTASWRTLSPLRTARSLNAAVLAAIPTRKVVIQILASRHGKTPLLAIRSVDFSCLSVVAGEDSPTSVLQRYHARAASCPDGICGRHMPFYDGNLICFRRAPLPHCYPKMGDATEDHLRDISLPTAGLRKFGGQWLL